MKKILISFLAVVIFFYPMTSNYIQQADAAVISKVVTTAAKKVAKEVVKDAAVNTAVKMTINFAMPLTEEQKYKALNSGYDAVCFPKNDGKKDTSCSKPVQVKKTLTSADKTAIAKKAEDILDKKTGVTGWVKFLDWFAPIFLIGGIFTWVSHELDSDSMGLFDEVAKQALIDLGFIKPLEPKDDIAIKDENGNPPVYGDYVTEETNKSSVEYNDNVISREIIFNSTNLTTSSFKMAHQKLPSSLLGIHLQRDVTGIDDAYMTSNITVRNLFHTNTFKDLEISQQGSNAYLRFANPTHYSFSNIQNHTHMNVTSNGTVIRNEFVYADGGTATIPNLNLNDITGILILPTLRSSSGRPDTVSDYHYMSRHINIYDKNNGIHKIKVSIGNKSEMTPREASILQVTETHTKNFATQLSYKVNILPNVQTYEATPYTPKIEEFSINTIMEGTHTTGNTIKVMPPTAIPIFTPDGTPVTPKEGSTTGWINVSTGEDITVNEDELIVKEPIRTPDGEGYQIPGATPVKDPPPVPKEEPPITEEDLEGLSCKRIKKPDFKPLANAVTTSFPFSIPWDLARMFNSAFSGIGSERPAFSYSFEFNGQVKEWNIELPKYFDSWTSFTRPLLVIIFDIGLIYAIYRFTKGGD